ncbi:MAG: RDD family protein [Myxococcales bacterium]|nr:RDD family protein [Myxococcales bacterium]
MRAKAKRGKAESGKAKSEWRPLELETPEGVPLHVQLASIRQRFSAFIVDLFVIAMLTWALDSLTRWVDALSAGSLTLWISAVLRIAGFVLHTLYFISFELLWRGRTPGKRLLSLRVVRRDGGPLRAEMIFARNLTREIELWLPLALLIAPTVLGGPASLVRTIGFIGLIVLALFPYFNTNRARLGDLFAGTVVVQEPNHRLLPDLAALSPDPLDSSFAFTLDQLEHYGIYELQVLEGLLANDHAPEEAFDVVVEKVCRKIGFPRDAVGERKEAFLKAFYAAQRARLEQKLLMGRRQERKRSGIFRPGG